jgi:hypothetical protein
VQNWTWCNERFCKETAHILEERSNTTTKSYTDGTKQEERVGYDNKKIIKRVRAQNTIYSAEQSAIITAIHFTMKEPGKKVSATDLLSILIAASDKKDRNNQKTT